MENFDQLFISEVPTAPALADVAETKGRYGDDSDGRDEPKPSPLETTDLSAIFGIDGALAKTLHDYELRPGQVEMAQLIKQAILEERTTLIEAPTGTGKSIAYLLPALLSEQTVVVATANKPLQNQLFRKDIPFLRKVLDQPIDAIVVKGRNNYVCNLKWEQEALERKRLAFLDKEDDQVAYLRQWVDDTSTGDVDDLPFVLTSDLRPRVVSYPDDCIGRNCAHFEDNCFVNQMRDKARQAQVIITNHHLLLNALELGEIGHAILPEAAIYVIDEAHQLENTATSVFEVETSDYALEQLLGRAVFKAHLEQERLEELRMHNLLAFSEVERLSDDYVFRIDAELEELKKLAARLEQLQDEMRQAHPYERPEEEGRPQLTPDESEEAANYDLALKGLASLATKLKTVASASKDDQAVRYAEKVSGSRHLRLRLHAAPIDPAQQLAKHLFDEGERTVICTSATLSTDGNFEHYKIRCGVQGQPLELIVDSFFDYMQQAILYQPALPAFNWRAKDRFYGAAAAEIERLLNVSRGRALCLFTSWSGLQQVHERLSNVVWPVQAQGQLPRNVMLDWFRRTPHSVLLATKSFWEGVDLPGDDLSLVVLDKLPFPTPSDPLHEARMKALDQAEDGSSFRKYMVPLMTLALKQGFGRLIRRTRDRGVVAILDERLTSRGYGRQARRDLPPARFSRDIRDVHQFYRDALASRGDFALNVSASGDDETAASHWRWQLTRLQDGRTDQESATLTDSDPAEAEVHAAVEGLRNLRARISSAGRRTNSFGVELRCSAATERRLADGSLPATLRRRWANECAIWGALEIIGLPDSEHGRQP